MRVGASYYPELFEPAQWREHLTTARELGLSVLRCGEFAWSALEPTPGDLRLDWVRDFLDLAAELGFAVVWCTPSATPPPYLFDTFPDLHATSTAGHELPVGIRRNYCPNHDGYRERCAAIARQLADAFASHPAIIGWQVDNELAGDGFTCWCPRCGGQFQQWLANRYDSLDALNAAWQAGVWSQVYTGWHQIPVPHPRFGAHTPSIRLDYRRFRSDSWLRFYKTQADALRAGGATRVTTNFYDLTWDVPFDLSTWSPELDVVGVSQYVPDPAFANFELALLSGIGAGRPLWVLEQKAGQQATQDLAGDDLGRIAQHLTRCARAGAEMGVFWHLVQHAAGCEQEHGAVLRHDGRPGPVGHAVKAAIDYTRRVAPAPVDDSVALLFSYPQHWVQETRAKRVAVWTYRDVLAQWHAAACDALGNPAVALPADASPETRLLIAPHFQMEEPGMLELLAGVLDRGGTVLTTGDFFWRDANCNVIRQAPLAALAMLGADVPDATFYELPPDKSFDGELDGQPLRGSAFCLQVGDHAAGRGRVHGHGVDGPALLDLPARQGRLVVLLTTLDHDSLAAVIKTLRG